MKWFANLRQWCRDKFGRIVTTIGSLAAGIDVFDVTPLKQPLADLIGNPQLATRILAGVALICLGLSWARHQQVASKVSKPPDASSIAKIVLILCVISIGAIAPRAYAAEVPVEKDAPKVDGHPLTSVVITQCNLVVAVYMTMQDGRLLRFDKMASVPANELMTMAYSATRSERIEVSCNETGEVGHEAHDPV